MRREKNMIFTICTKNYIGLARVLKESVFDYNVGMDFKIILADEFEDDIEFESEDIIEFSSLKIIDGNKYIEMAFKYNLTEFCTAIKPYSIMYFLESGYDKVIYLDPDVAVFSPLDDILEKLETYSMCLTPHFLSYISKSENRHFEDEVRFAGIYNLGFIAVKNNELINNFLSWWGSNLQEKCFTNHDKSMFTDQKWLDFAPVLIGMDELYIISDLGYNIAPWNYFEREILEENNCLMVKKRDGKNYGLSKVVFVHYSGYDYMAMMDERIIQKNIGHDTTYEDINLLYQWYARILKKKRKEIDKYFFMEYSYGTYSNGIKIDYFQRRLYNGLLEYGRSISNPFDSKGEYYSMLNTNKMIQKKMDVESDIVSKKESKYLLGKLKKIHFLGRILYNIVGYKRYQIIIRFVKRFSRFENQIFLLDGRIVFWE